ncbi:hypothetical protein UFOVP257_29 [uncultured Caudovirales phage]|uniref:Neck protein n=1 Tax=uncultured Caudovirales phage TaxID=2100421 RepID=A0A6J5LJ07_9CAUD|nr:hypothetical protein UFOVP257_29 [uncultured Caudovirales phage]
MALTSDLTNFYANGVMVTDSLYNPATGTQSGSGHIAYDPNEELGSITAPELESVNIKRKEITDYIRMRLADGIVDVELDKEHYDMAVTQALIKYRQRASNSQEESYAFLKLKPETQEYILPKEIMEVRGAYRRGIGSVTGTTASQFEPFSSGYLNTYMLVAGRVGGLLNYELFVDYQKLSMKMFGGYLNFTFNKITKKLVLIRKMPYAGTNIHEDQMEDCLLHVYNYKPDSMLLNDFQAFPWIQEYSYSFAKRILGEAREKFASIVGPQGGTQLNGGTLKAEAATEMLELEQQLKDYVDGSMPLTWVIG